MSEQPDWHGERADVLTQLATLALTMSNVESMVREQGHRIEGLIAGLAEMRTSEARREGVLERVQCDLLDHDERLGALEKLAPVAQVTVWVAGVLAVSVLALVWALVTGQAVVSFK